MRNYRILKALIVLPLLAAIVAGVFPVSSRASSVAFNNGSDDQPTLRVANYTVSPNGRDWYPSITNTNAGDVVSFLFYYHNTGDTAAINTRATISLSLSGSSVTASGRISSDNASYPAFGMATAYAASGQTFQSAVFHSAVFYPDQNLDSSSPLPFGQSGSEITSSGVVIGNIEPGWSHQGFLVVRFTIQGTGTPTGGGPASGSISASPNPCTIPQGGSLCTSNITWTTQNVTAARVYVGNSDGSSEQLFANAPNSTLCANQQSCPAPWIQANTTYIFRLYDYSSGGRGALLGQVTVTAAGGGPAPSPASGSIFASPNPCSIPAAGSVCTSYITWSTTNSSQAQVWVGDGVNEKLFGNATSCTDANCPAPWIQAGGTYIFKLYDYSSGSRGTLLSQVSVTANAAPPAGNPTLVIRPSSANINVNQTFQFNAYYDPDGPNAPQPEQLVTTSANWSSNNTGIASSNGGGSFVGTGGGTATITANYAGLTSAASLSVTSVVGGTPSGSISANPNPCTIGAGGSVCTTNITWTTQNVTAAQVWVGDGASEKLFGNATSCADGNCPAWWIAANTNYNFKLYDYSSGSRGALLGQVNVTAQGGVPPPVPSGSISASPNPCTASGSLPCTSYITWNTQNVSAAQVWVGDGSSEKLFGNAPSCSDSNCPAPWIQPNQTYIFRLYDYSSGSRGITISQVTVTAASGGSVSGSISASPNPCTIPQGNTLCTSYLTWNTSNASAAQVWVTDGTTGEKLFGNAPSCSFQNCPAWWIAANTNYIFKLFDYSSGSRGALLGQVTVTANAAPPAGNPTLVIRPSSANINVNQTFQFNAYYDPDGPTGPQSEQLVTTSANWSSNNGSFAASNGNGYFVGTGAGTATITAAYAGLTATAPLTVTCQSNCGAQPDFSLTIVPTDQSAAQGTSATYRVDANSVNGFSDLITLSIPAPNPFPQGITYAFSPNPIRPGQSSNLMFTIASNAPAGTMEFWVNGRGSAFGDHSYRATLTVTGGGGNATFVIEPSSLTISVGGVAQYRSFYDPDGTGPQSRQDVTQASTWNAVNTSIGAPTSNKGEFRGVGAGSTAIVASYNGASMGANLTVNPGGGAPTAVTLPATGVTTNSATLNGTVNPNGAATTYHFDYGTSQNSLFNSTTNQSIGSGTGDQQAIASIQGLTPSTTYYFQIVAQNSFGTARGSILSFTTGSAGTPSLVIRPTSATIATGQTFQFNAYYDPDGLTGPQGEQLVTGNAQWSSSNGTVASSNGNGFFVGNNAGTVIVTATYSGTSATASLTVTGTQGSAPTAVTNLATNVTDTAAALNGQVNPNGAATTYKFEYGTNPNSLTQSTQTQSAGSGTNNQSVGASVTGLTPNTTYYFRVSAQNSFGTSVGSILSFTTQTGQQQGSAPTAVTQSATNVTANSATLNGKVNPNGAITQYRFEYGTNPNSLGTFTSYQSVGSGTGDQNVIQSVSGLQPNTTYYFRVSAQNGFGTANGSVLSFTTQTDQQQGNAPTATTLTATNVSQNTATLNGRVNPNGASTQYRFEYGTNPNSLGSFTSYQNIGSGNGDQNVTQQVSSLAANTTYYFRVVAQNSFGTTNGAVLSFTTTSDTIGGGPPTAVTLAATNVTQNNATLNGRVNPNGAATSYRFEYGTNPNSLASFTGYQSIGAGSSDQNVTQQISGLQANTTYFFRVVAQNVNGVVQGSVLSFTTTTDQQQGSAPVATTLTASNITQNNATLNGAVNPNGAATQYRFEYGTNPNSLGTFTAYQSIGSGTSQQNVSQQISGLSSNTTYYFRVVAQNSFGTTNGSILSFTTTTDAGQGGPPIVQTNSANSITDTAATLNGTVNPNGASAQYRFEYGTNPNSLGQATGYQSIGSGTNSQNFFANVSGLSSNTTYYFRIVAQNSFGTAQGSVLSFTTTNSNFGGNAPLVQTTAASNITQNSATLNGTVNPNNSPTNYWFEYGLNTSLGGTSGFQSLGSGNYIIPVSNSVSSLQPNTTYYFRVVAQNQFGTAYGAIQNFNTNTSFFGNNPPLVQTSPATNISSNTATLNGQVKPNGSSATAWFEYGVDSNNLTFTTSFNSVGTTNGYIPFSQTVSNLNPGTTYYFRAVARNNYSNAYGQILSFTAGGTLSPVGQAPFVTTKPATFVTQNSALLNGTVNPNGGLTTAWFEYGASFSLGLRTSAQPIGSANTALDLSSAATGLAPGTIFYFRAAAQNQYGTNYGQILSFQTPGRIFIPTPTPTPTPTPRPAPPTVIVRGGINTSCISLVPSLSVSEIYPGQEFTYTITYRNGCSFDLANGVLDVILPVETDFISSSYPVFSQQGNKLTYNLGVVGQNVEAAINIRAVAKNYLKKGDNLIFTAILTFTDTKGGFQSLTAYLTAFVNENLVATATSTAVYTASIGTFFGNLFGSWGFWLFLILLILAIILYLLFGRRRYGYGSSAHAT